VVGAVVAGAALVEAGAVEVAGVVVAVVFVAAVDVVGSPLAQPASNAAARLKSARTVKSDFLNKVFTPS
jgi:hypothetical protein